MEEYKEQLKNSDDNSGDVRLMPKLWKCSACNKIAFSVFQPLKCECNKADYKEIPSLGIKL